MLKIFHLRKNYRSSPLHAVDPDPFRQFEEWLKVALRHKVQEPTAMTLSTVSQHNIPSARTVLLKEWSPRGALFFTNSKSQKAFELEENPVASCLFWWKELERQVSFTGLVHKVPRRVTAAYFAKRPFRSQIASWVSMQDQQLTSREVLHTAFEELRKKWRGKKKIPLPPHWCGYRLVPFSFQFWQGQPDRLHDRFLYVKKNNRWIVTRLYP